MITAVLGMSQLVLFLVTLPTLLDNRTVVHRIMSGGTVVPLVAMGVAFNAEGQWFPAAVTFLSASVWFYAFCHRAPK